MAPLIRQYKIILIIFVLVIVSFLIYFLTQSKGYKAISFTPLQLQDLLKKQNEYVVIDVRSKKEYDKGHIPGAIQADYYNTEALKKAAGNKIPITYCAFSAMRGPYAAYQLYQAGYKNAAILDGGITAWAEDIQGLDSEDPKSKSVFMHPKNIFPEREKSASPNDRGSVEFNITAKRFSFSPNQIIVQHGQKVTLNIVSLDIAHGFALPEFGIEEELLPNEPKTITFTADRKGNFPFVCNVVCGRIHDHASMVGNLIVK